MRVYHTKLDKGAVLLRSSLRLQSGEKRRKIWVNLQPSGCCLNSIPRRMVDTSFCFRSHVSQVKTHRHGQIFVGYLAPLAQKNPGEYIELIYILYPSLWNAVEGFPRISYRSVSSLLMQSSYVHFFLLLVNQEGYSKSGALSTPLFEAPCTQAAPPSVVNVRAASPTSLLVSFKHSADDGGKSISK